MTDTLLALIPTYGLWLIFAVVAFSCLAIPLPSSIMVLTAGGFAAAGDLIIWQVFASAFGGFFVGDQAAFHVARRGGPPLIERVKNHARFSRLVERAEHLLDAKGGHAVFLSRTVVSPVGPYMTLISGAVGMDWRRYTVFATAGALCWTLAYVVLGYGVVDQLAQYASILWYLLGALAALCALAASGWWLHRSYRRHKAEADQAASA